MIIAERVEPKFKVKFYGTRGSIPVPDPGYQEFGGNTTCISITDNIHKRIGILDAGTGIRSLGKEIVSPHCKNKYNDIFILFSHFHWDHILGFPFFEPAYDPERRIIISAMGKNRAIKDLREIFNVAMQSEYFPIGIDDMHARMEFLIPGRDTEIYEDILVFACKHKHPGGAYSFRIEWQGKILVICTDIEHGNKIDRNIVELANNADVLIHDGQYTTEELKRKKGWGHSSYEQAIRVAEQAGCSQLVITHHDPDHNDDFLKLQEEKCKRRFERCMFAREGMEIIF